MSEPAELKLEGLTKRYGDLVAVDNVSFTVPPATYVVLLGPSGSGKTTVLSMLGGFTLPSAGRIHIGAQDVTLTPAAQRPTATVFQDYALFPHLSVAGNVGFGLSVRGYSSGDIARRVSAALDLVGLVGFAPRPIAETSGGQRQRIALARALVIDPALLLLDEPLGALDLRLRRQMQDELRRIQRAEGRTFVHVTHDQEEAMAIADLIVIMNNGRVEDLGPPARVYEKPRTRFCASFLGESSVLDGVVAASGQGRLALDTVCGRMEIAGAREPGSKVSVALRPEALRIGAATEGEYSLGTLRVEQCAFQGSFMRLSGTTETGVQLLAKVPPRELREGAQSVPIFVRRGDVVLLED
jgi:spermidine/putrescine transport system ATP-binding protein